MFGLYQDKLITMTKVYTAVLVYLCGESPRYIIMKNSVINKRYGIAPIQTQDLLNASQMLLPLSHWAHCGRAAHKQHLADCLEASTEFQMILSLICVGMWTYLWLK